MIKVYVWEGWQTIAKEMTLKEFKEYINNDENIGLSIDFFVE